MMPAVPVPTTTGPGGEVGANGQLVQAVVLVGFVGPDVDALPSRTACAVVDLGVEPIEELQPLSRIDAATMQRVVVDLASAMPSRFAMWRCRW